MVRTPVIPAAMPTTASFILTGTSCGSIHPWNSTLALEIEASPFQVGTIFEDAPALGAIPVNVEAPLEIGTEPRARDDDLQRRRDLAKLLARQPAPQ